MRFVLFCHSLVSDWNHGSAHFLRGVCSELLTRGHEVDVWEPRGGWSRSNLIARHGQEPIRRFHAAYPRLASSTYDLATLDLDVALDEVDAVLVHAWNDPELVRRLGEHRDEHGGYALLFHDSLAHAGDAAPCDLTRYDGVLAASGALRERYLARGLAHQAWTWHEAADPAIAYPRQSDGEQRGVVWIDPGEGERGAELEEFLIAPLRRLRLRAAVHGVRWPEAAVAQLREAGIEHLGWLPDVEIPQAFAQARCTVHLPSAARQAAAPGVPGIRVFQALACGIPLVSAPWEDSDGLFRAGHDLLVARDGAEMERHIADLVADPAYARDLAANGLERIRARHTCAHRVDELLAILADLGADEDREEAILLDDAEEGAA